MSWLYTDSGVRRVQASRYFEIVYILLEKKKATAGELAAHFEVSERTILRDIEALSMAGIPVYATRGRGGRHLPAGAVCPA